MEALEKRPTLNFEHVRIAEHQGPEHEGISSFSWNEQARYRRCLRDLLQSFWWTYGRPAGRTSRMASVLFVIHNELITEYQSIVNGGWRGCCGGDTEAGWIRP